MSTSNAAGKDPRFTRHILSYEDAFVRADGAPDPNFYSAERMVEHLDAPALATVERLVGSLVMEDSPAILDLMASWDSHIPESVSPSRVVGLGLNRAELDANPVLTERDVHDRNAEPVIPFPDQSFVVVLNVVSVEYLTQPARVFQEVGRILKPGGLFLVVFSNRWFPPKVVRVWEDASEHEHISLVEEFFREGGVFSEAELFVSMGLPRPEDDDYHALGVPSDPVFALFAEKEGGGENRSLRTVPRDAADMAVDAESVAVRKQNVGETLTCPHCIQPLSKWEVPDDPIIDWPNDYMYICFNDGCPFVVRGWRFMWEQGNEGHSYRYLFNPLTGASTTVPIQTLQDLRLGIMESGPG
jgi:SAM-dependent methyltransferase